MITVLGLTGLALLVGLAVEIAVHHDPTKDLGAPRLEHSEIRTTVLHHPGLRARLRSRFDARAATGLTLTLVVVIFIVATTVIGVLAAMARTKSGFTLYDIKIASWVAHHDTASSTRVLRYITQFGGAVVIVPLSVVVAAAEYWRVRSRAVFPFLLLVVGGQFLLANTIKFLVGRARPSFNPLTGFSGSSFPSGHATAAAATYAAFALLIGRQRSTRTRAVLVGTAAGAAVLISGTRVLLGVHYLSDVVAGLCLGWAWFAICSLAFGGRFLHFGAPIELAEQVAERDPPPTTVGGR